MKLAAVVLCAFTVFQQVYGDAAPCVAATCLIKDNCRCASTTGPLALADTPQLIVLAFVDAMRDSLYNEKWAPLVEPRVNPDGAFISATFYVPHEYSDYQIVHDVATNGFEVGVHSVTNNVEQAYWREASEELLEDEFGSQRKIIAKFANIPIANIVGGLTPQLQLAGDTSVTAYAAQGLIYDNSLPSRIKIYPYTLDFAADQTCDTGADCPKDSHPGFWMSPIIDLIADDGDVCATLFGCFRTRYNQTSKEISDWLVGQVQTIKTTNRAPITLIIEEKFINSVAQSYAGLTDALDRLQKDEEIFLVSQARVIEWLKDPVPISKFNTSAVAVTTGCVKDTCYLTNPDGDPRTMVSCVPCPKNYPWLGNPEGN